MIIIKKESSRQMGCYLIVTNRLFLGQTEEVSMGKASESAAKLSSNIAKELEIA